MKTVVVAYPHDARKLRFTINALLKSGACTHVRKMNYIQSFIVDADKNIHKQQEKIVVFTLSDGQEKKFEGVMSKQWPEYQQHLLPAIF